MQDEIIKYPEPEFTDEFSKWIKAAVGDIIPLGNTFTSIFSSFVAPKIEKRKEEFFREVALGIWKLSKKMEEFNPDKLKKNDEFINSLLSAVQIAQRTNNKDKLTYLRNAVLSSVIIKNAAEFEKAQMINIIEDMTGLHFLILKFYGGSESGARALTGHLSEFVTLHSQEVSLNIDLFSLILNDLEKNYLLYRKVIPSGWGYDHYAFGQTHLGKKLLQYISNPIIDD